MAFKPTYYKVSQGQRAQTENRDHRVQLALTEVQVHKVQPDQQAHPVHKAQRVHKDRQVHKDRLAKTRL
jgi:hypothetical protein